MYNGTQILDVHGHVSSPASVRAWAVNLLASNTAIRSPLGPGGNRGGGRGGMDLSDEAFEKAAQEHVTYMDARNIDVQIIGPRPFTTMGWMQPHLIPAWSTFTNDCIYKQTQIFPDRFIGAAMLPEISEAPDLSNCVAEIERTVNEYGFKAVYVSPDPAGMRTTPGMNEAYWYPVYAKCQELSVPIIVHGTNCLDPRIRILPQNYQVGFMFEQFLANQLLSHSDVFQRFPDLKVLICHGGGALDRFIKTDGHLAQKDLSKNLFYDTCVYDIPVLEAAIKQKSVQQTVFGTEAPGSGGAVRPETGKTCDDLVPIISGFDFLSDQDKIDIFNTNSAAFCPAFNMMPAAK